MTTELEYRKMVLSDLDRVMEIEHRSFTLPWSREAYENELSTNHFASYLVACYEEQVVGYAGMWVILDEAHITNIAIDPAFRGRRLGERLMQEMMVQSMARGAERMTLEVRVSNLPAQRLYEKLGFVSHGVRKGYYTDNNEDAMIMWAELSPQGAVSGRE